MLIDEQSDRLVDRGTEVHRLGWANCENPVMPVLGLDLMVDPDIGLPTATRMELDNLGSSWV